MTSENKKFIYKRVGWRGFSQRKLLFAKEDEMKRESNPGIEKALKQNEIMLESNGCTLLQARAIPRLTCYLDMEIKKMKKNPSDAELFLHFKKAVSLTLDEVGEQALAEQVQTFTTSEQLAVVLRNAFDMHQLSTALNSLRRLCSKFGT